MIRSLLFIFAFAFLFTTITPIVAAVTCPANFTDTGAGVCVPTGTGLSQASIGHLLETFMKWLLGLVAVIGVLAFAISGIQYLTAVGDESQAETAKRNIKYAIIGVVVALSGLIIITAIDQIFVKGNAGF